MIEGIVNQAVSPSGIAALARYGLLDTTRAPRDTTRAPSRVDPTKDVRMRYRDARTFVVTVSVRDSSVADTVSFVLRRRGLTWQLVRVVIPNLAPR
jgi:hypothetical protein